MIFRALLISFALHLAILISAVPGLPRGTEKDQGGRRGTAAILRGAGPVRDAPNFARAMEGRSEKSVTGPKKTTNLKPAKAADNSKNTAFFGPTVAFENHGRNAGRQAGDEDASEAFLPAGDGEREYRLNLAREARRYRRHHSGVDRRDAEGVVVVSISMPLLDHRPEIRLQQSSGDHALDRAALDMMEQAAKVAAIPQELQGRRFRIAVPVEYRQAAD